MTAKEPCEGCGGLLMPGVRHDNNNGYPVPEGWQGIERCDTCERYDDDIDAAIAFVRKHCTLKEVRLLVDRQCGFTTIVPVIGTKPKGDESEPNGQ